VGSERSAEAKRSRKVKVQDRRWPVANVTDGRISAVATLPSASGDGIPSRIRQAVANTPFLLNWLRQTVASPQIFPINTPFSQNVGIMLFLGEFCSLNSLKKHS